MITFMIVGRGEPLYEFESKGDNGEGTTALRQFVLHASLDSLHSILWSNSSTFLRVIDRFNSHLVSSYVTPGGTTMLLLHNGKSEDIVRQFFVEAHEIYVKNMMNPVKLYLNILYTFITSNSIFIVYNI